MKSFTTLKNYFSKTELILWSTSVVLILIAFCLFDRTSYMTLWTSLIGVTSLIFCAKGNPMGQLFDGAVQPALRNDFPERFLLWRNDHISGNDHAYGCVLSDHMAEKSI